MLHNTLHAILKVCRFHLVEALLILIVQRDLPFRFGADVVLKTIAGLLRFEGKNGFFHHEGMQLGDLRMPLLMAPDIGGKPIPDPRQQRFGVAAITPAGQDDLRVDGHPGAADMTAPAAFNIGRLASEPDSRCAGMPAAGTHRRRSAGVESPIQFVGGVAANVEIGKGFLRDHLGRCALPQARKKDDGK
jgi:hypothetical protein